MNDMNQQAIEVLLKGINTMIEDVIKNTTKIYNGQVVSQDSVNKWNVKYNGNTYSIPQYGNFPVKVGKIVKVFVPQGNVNLSFFM